MPTGTLQLDDLVRAQRLHLRPRRAYARVGVVLLALGGVTAIVLLVAPGEWHWGRLVMPACLAYLFASWYSLLPYLARRQYAQQKDLQRELSFHAAEDGLHARNELGQAIRPWSDIRKWKEDEHLFLLYITDSLYLMVPKRMFEQEAELAAFRGFLPQGKAIPA
jgi:hypothetical protein